MYYFIFITPILGLFRNYSKYKKTDIKLFLRTPIIFCFIYIFFLLQGFREEKFFYLSLISERWILLLYKGIYSYFNNDYIKNKEKYMKKYKMKYK